MSIDGLPRKEFPISGKLLHNFLQEVLSIRPLLAVSIIQSTVMGLIPMRLRVAMLRRGQRLPLLLDLRVVILVRSRALCPLAVKCKVKDVVIAKLMNPTFLWMGRLTDLLCSRKLLIT